MNLLGLDIIGVGNHEFDEGVGRSCCGCRTAAATRSTAARTATPFYGSEFQYLAANVVDKSTRNPILPPYEIRSSCAASRSRSSAMTLEGTPTIVTPAGVAGLNFLDEADTVNRLVTRAEASKGVKAIVVLIHEGGSRAAPAYGTRCGASDPGGSTSPPIVDRMDDEVDVVVTGHTHAAVQLRRSTARSSRARRRSGG